MDPARSGASPTSSPPRSPGLKAGNVTITDGSGAMLWPAAATARRRRRRRPASKTAAEARYNAGVEASLNAMLDRTLGAGKAQVVVHSDLNVDKTDAAEAAPTPRRASPLTAEEDDRDAEGHRRGRAAAPPARRSNLAQLRGNAGAAARQLQLQATRPTDATYGVDKTITKTPGPRHGQPHGRRRAARQVRAAKPSADRPLQDALSSAAGIQADARRHAERHAGRVRQAGRDPGGKAGPIPAGVVEHPQGRRARPRRAAVPVLRHPPPAQARARR